MRHTPKQQQLDNGDILSFADAMAQSGADSEFYDRDKWLYIPDFYTEYRYILGTKGTTPLIAVGINPSTAAPGCLDNTLKSVERIALHNGYDSFIMFNVYAQRATDPNLMHKTANAKLHQENMAAFRWVLEQSSAQPSIWAAWGSIITKRPYLAGCVRDMLRVGEEYKAAWYHAGPLSVHGGHPHHPLYLRKDSVLEPFQVDTYLRGME